MIRIQTEPFVIADEMATLRAERTNVGALVLFTGSVRDHAEGRTVSALTLEHYPGMTEAALAEIEMQAHRRWPLTASLIVHRYGRLEPGDDIVLVITLSDHRQAAFEACAFLMDWLKTKAPFWKLEEGDGEARWVEAKASDDAAAERW